MKKKKKTNGGKTILFVLLFIIAMAAAFFGAKKIMEIISEPEKPIVENSTIEFDVNSYSVYFDTNNDLGFNFVICELNVTDENKIDLDLNQLITNEDIMLSTYNDYLLKLVNSGYDIGFTMSSEYTSDSNNMTIKLLIPFTKEEDIKVYLNGEKVFGFSHKSHNENIITLKSDANIKEDGYALKVSNAYAINKSMYQNGTEYEVSSNARIYVFKIEVINADKAIKITDAKFVSSSLNETISVLDSSFTSDKYENIYGVYLNAGDVGYLFFEVYVGNETTKPNYDGELMIKLSGTDKWVELSTNFN